MSCAHCMEQVTSIKNPSDLLARLDPLAPPQDLFEQTWAHIAQQETIQTSPIREPGNSPVGYAGFTVAVMACFATIYLLQSLVKTSILFNAVSRFMPQSAGPLELTAILFALIGLSVTFAILPLLLTDVQFSNPLKTSPLKTSSSQLCRP